MLISGFTIIRNATKFYFPVKESILSILPIVDEYIVAVGNCCPDDNTLEEIKSINSPKIKIIQRNWDTGSFRGGEIFRHETNVALSCCKGKWCFYLQADEVIHESALQTVSEACKKYLEIPEIDGMLLNYRHFWGDYEHMLQYHGICNKEIRIIRNNSGIQSFNDANSFRKGNKKLVVVHLPVYVYHYGWVRPPEIMQHKKQEQDMLHNNIESSRNCPEEFDFGPMNRLKVFSGSHPGVMQHRISSIHWKGRLNYSNIPDSGKRGKHKHEKFKYRILTLIENIFFGGKQIFGWTNWVINKKYL